MHSHTTELLPCPFCNGTPELRETGGWSGIGCNTNKCPAYLHALMFRTPAEAIAAWNRRSYATALGQQAPATKDEALRVAREALTNLLRVFPTDDDMIEAGWGVSEVNEACDVYDAGQAALRTIALAVEGPSDGVEVDRDSDGELLIDWFPSPGRMLTMSLRHDGRLSYAFRWDGEQAHGTAQMPPAVQSVALAGGWGELRKDFDFDLASASGAVGETAEPNASQLIDDLEWAVLARSQGVPGSADRLHDAKQAIRNALAAVPGTSNGQENGNGR